MRLSNAKVAEGLVHVPGVRQWMGAVGWELVEEEFMTLPEVGVGVGVGVRLGVEEEFMTLPEAADAPEP